MTYSPEETYLPDTRRPAHFVGPFVLAPGRVIVDTATNRAVAYVKGGDDLRPTEYDDDAHALACILNGVDRTPRDCDTVAAMTELCERKAREGSEFWQRLAGSVRKARSML